jgi:hypothetical protein
MSKTAETYKKKQKQNTKTWFFSNYGTCVFLTWWFENVGIFFLWYVSAVLLVSTKIIIFYNQIEGNEQNSWDEPQNTKACYKVEKHGECSITLNIACAHIMLFEDKIKNNKTNHCTKHLLDDTLILEVVDAVQWVIYVTGYFL